MGRGCIVVAGCRGFGGRRCEVVVAVVRRALWIVERQLGGTGNVVYYLWERVCMVFVGWGWWRLYPSD